MKIEKLEGKRWFIWTIVIVIVAGVALVTYIMTSDTDYSVYGSTITHHSKPSSQGVKK